MIFETIMQRLLLYLWTFYFLKL